MSYEVLFGNGIKMIKVKELFEMCKIQIEKWNWEKSVWITNDDDWNWIHELPCWFTDEEEDVKLLDCYDDCINHKNIVVLW